MRKLLIFLTIIGIGFEVFGQVSLTDKEIIERLSRLEEGQKRLEEGQKAIIREIDKRFEAIDKRFDQLITVFIGMVAAFAGIVAVTIGFAIWDRRTALAPALRRTKDLEDREERIEKVLREFALKLPELAEALRRNGLL